MALLAGLLAVIVLLLCATGVGAVYLYRKTLSRIRDRRTQIQQTRRRIEDLVQEEYGQIDDLIGVAETYMKRQKDELAEIRELSLEQTGSLDRLAEQHLAFADRVEAFFQAVERFPELADDDDYRRVRNSIRDSRIDVADAFGTYNNLVEEYNSMLADQPARFVASREGLQEAERVTL